MGRPSKQVQDFMAAYKVDSDEIWEVHGTTWVVKHKALERIAAEKGITFDMPTVIEANASAGIAVVCVTGVMGERKEWSIGEASPKNNKNSYPYAMAEKRSKDRVILKLLNAHGALYSEAEADEFGAGKNADGQRVQLAKKDSRGVYAKLQAEINECVSYEQLKEWGVGNAERIDTLPDDWQDTLRLLYQERSTELKQKQAA